MAAGLLLAVAPLQAAGPPPSYGAPDAPRVAVVYQLEVRTNDPAEMAYVIGGELLRRYVAEKKIAATDAEIADYTAGLRKFMVEETQRRKARSIEIERLLQDKALPGAQRQALEKEAAIIKSLGDEIEQPDAAAQRQMASAFVMHWKLNRALYRQYGGRVIYQQAGPEPLDAYRKYFEEQQALGHFRILDPKFEQAFWSYYRDDRRHVFVPDAEAKAAIDTPPWQQKAPRN